MRPSGHALWGRRCGSASEAERPSGARALLRGCCLALIVQHPRVHSQQLECHPKCKTCHLFDYNLEWHCTECLPGYTLWVDGCYEDCPAGQYRNGTQCEDCYKYCLPDDPDTCYAHCVSCVGDLRHECTECEAGYHFDTRNVCVKDCDGGEFPTIDGESCGECDSLCYRCLTEHKISCTACYQGYYLKVVDEGTQSGECMAECPDGFYRDSPDDTTRCLQCAEYCLSCHSKDLCFVCDEGAELLFGVCTSTAQDVDTVALDFDNFLDSGAGVVWDTSAEPVWGEIRRLSEADFGSRPEL